MGSASAIFQFRIRARSPYHAQTGNLRSISGQPALQAKGSETQTSQNRTSGEPGGTWPVSALNIQVDYFRVRRDPGTIPRGAANRLRKRSLL
jgi:hypothetical protein